MNNRYPRKKKGPDGKLVCRGCGGSIPKGRYTWCSLECYKTHCPAEVIAAVKQRDKGVCQLCGVDTKRATEVWRNEKPKQPDYNTIHNVWPYDYAGYLLTPEYKAYYVALESWNAACPKPEYDHIIPFSEGGPTTLDNMRTLCCVCHTKRTAEWRRGRSRSGAATVKESLTVGGQGELCGGKV